MGAVEFPVHWDGYKNALVMGTAGPAKISATMGADRDSPEDGAPPSSGHRQCLVDCRRTTPHR